MTLLPTELIFPENPLVVSHPFTWPSCLIECPVCHSVLSHLLQCPLWPSLLRSAQCVLRDSSKLPSAPLCASVSETVSAQLLFLLSDPSEWQCCCKTHSKFLVISHLTDGGFPKDCHSSSWAPAASVRMARQSFGLCFPGNISCKSPTVLGSSSCF